MKSPLGLNRKTAQVLNGMMKRASYEAGQIWVQGLVFLSAASECRVQGPASRDRIHVRRTILDALQNEELVQRLTSRAITRSTPSTQAVLDRILRSEDTAPKRARPTRKIREYEIERALETHDNCKELLARNSLSGDRRVLRIYSIPPLADDEERERIHRRARWEAQVLGRLGKCEGILAADPPFTDEAGIVLPLEYFESITLASWVDRYALTKKADLKARTGVWLEIAANELPLIDELVPFLMARSGPALDEFGRWVARRRSVDWVLAMLEYLPMSTLTREDLLWRFGKVEDPEIEARRQRILEVLLEASPQTKQQLIERGQLAATRASLRRVLVQRQLTPGEDADARIEACTDLATLERWLDRAVTAVSVSDVLR